MADADSDLDLTIDQSIDKLGAELHVDEEPAGAEPTPAKPAPSVTSLAQPAKPAAPADPNAPIAYPKSWKQDYSKHWPTLPRELQEYVTNVREKEYLDGLEQYKAGHTAYGEINQVIQPYMPRLTALGMPPAQAIQALLNADWALSQGTMEQKAEMVRQICVTYGIDPAALGAKSSGEPQYQTEGEKVLAARLNEVTNQLRTFAGQTTATQRVAIDKEVAAFWTDPAHPYVEECGQDMAMLLAADKTLSLQDAYDKAVWANPITRAKEMERVSKETAEKERKVREDAAKNAARARTATLRGKPTEKGTGAAPATWEEDLTTTAAAIANRP